MGGLSIETNSSGNTAFPEHRTPGENPSENDLRLFHNTINGQSTDRDRLLRELNPPGDLSSDRSANILEALAQQGSYALELKARAGSRGQQAVLSQTVADFKRQFAGHAESRDGFHRLLSQAFGNIDADRAEGIRLQTLDGDFSWLPKIELVSGDHTFRGAYSAEDGTVFLNPSLLDDPADALRVLTEEIGHHLQTLVRKGDSPGDEGELFRRLFAGETLSGDEIATLRRENDHGMVIVDGETIRVEFEVPFIPDDPFVFDDPPVIERPPMEINPEPEPIDTSPPIPVDNPALEATLANQEIIISGSQPFLERGGPIAGTEAEVDGLKLVRDDVNDIDIVGATNAGAYINGRVIEPEEGFSNFRLEKMEGTHNSYTLLPDITPYDHLVESSGIRWQDIDRTYLHLIERGFPQLAEQLQNDGVLPSRITYEPGSEIATIMLGHYDRLAEANAPRLGISTAAFNDLVNDLS